jgi:hypothetical protein
MSTASRFLGTGVVIGLAMGLLVGVGLTQPGRAAASGPSGAPQAASSQAASSQAVSSNEAAIGAPAAVPWARSGGTTGSSSETAIAYPFFGGSPGIAPDYTIVVTGIGQADVASDGSDHAGAEATALATALADAKAQADAIAAATGLSISGVLSVSASVSPSYAIMPMMGSVSGSGPGQPVPPMAPQPAYPQTLGVSVTVEYKVS